MLQKIKFWGLIILGLWLIQICNRRTNSDYTPKKNKYSIQGCFEDQGNAINFIKEKTQAIHDAKVMYNSEPLSDCSGMFLRTIQSLEQECPKFDYPHQSRARSSRDLAKYYHEKGKLTIIKDAANASKYLKPGMAVFFGQNRKTYQRFNIDYLTSPGTGIEHVGLIVSIKENADQVESYQMFHGRSAGKPAAITTQYFIYPHGDYPPYGNWGQQLVAVAPILPQSLLRIN